MIVRLAKIVVSVSLITILLWRVEWGEIAEKGVRFDPMLLLLGFLLLCVQYPLSAWKWQKSLRLHGIEQPFPRLLRIACIAFFFNNFLPTAIGGDAYRAYRVFGYSRRKVHAISAVVVERILGILALLALGYVAAAYLVITDQVLDPDVIRWILIVATAGGLLTLLAWKLDFPAVRRLGQRIIHVDKLEPIADSFRVIQDNRGHLLGLTGLSLLFQAVAIVTIAVLFAAIGVPGAVAESAFTAAAAGVASMLPISINGVGVMEGSFVLAALEAELPYSESVVIALFLRGFMILSSVAFGIVYAMEPKEQQAAAQMTSAK